MQWTDSGVVLGTRRHGETSVVLELLTTHHGRHLGLVRSGRSKRNAAMLQPGNSVLATWSARIEEQLGTYIVEAETQRVASLIDSAAALYAIGYLASLIRLLPERDQQHGLHAGLVMILDHLDRPLVAAPLIVRFEMALLSALGFGLDLTSCASTGKRQDLIYVSPKSGRAVSREAGKPYRDRLFPLPGFMIGIAGDNLSPDSLLDGFRLTQYFLEQHVFEPRGIAIPEQRASLVDAMMRHSLAVV
jgi:DNA repair protein RecO (recombination protein O)